MKAHLSQTRRGLPQILRFEGFLARVHRRPHGLALSGRRSRDSLHHRRCSGLLDYERPLASAPRVVVAGRARVIGVVLKGHGVRECAGLPIHLRVGGQVVDGHNAHGSISRRVEGGSDVVGRVVAQVAHVFLVCGRVRVGGIVGLGKGACLQRWVIAI